MRFRTFILFILLLSQPLAAFELNCGMPANDAAAGTTVSTTSNTTMNDKHCGSHANTADDSVNSHEQTSDQHPTGHAAAGGHCQFCASGAFVLPVMTLAVVAPLAATLTLPIAEPAPQFLARPLFRPPIH